jgi:hypothetical protein
MNAIANRARLDQAAATLREFFEPLKSADLAALVLEVNLYGMDAASETLAEACLMYCCTDELVKRQEQREQNV